MKYDIDGAALSEITGLTDRRHRQMADAGVFPAPKVGIYDLAAVTKGLLLYYRKPAESLNLEKEQARLTSLKADLAEVELAEARRQVIPVEAACRFYESLAVPMRRIVELSALNNKEKDSIYELMAGIDMKGVVASAVAHYSERNNGTPSMPQPSPENTP